MKTYFLCLFTGLLNLFILLSFAAAAASVSYLPLAAMVGSALLFFISTTVYLYRPKWSAVITLVGSLLILSWLCGFIFELIMEIAETPKDSFDYVPVGIGLFLLVLVCLSGYDSYRLLFKRKDIGWNSGNPKFGLISKIGFTFIPFLVFLFRLLSK